MAPTAEWRWRQKDTNTQHYDLSHLCYDEMCREHGSPVNVVLRTLESKFGAKHAKTLVRDAARLSPKYDKATPKTTRLIHESSQQAAQPRLEELCASYGKVSLLFSASYASCPYYLVLHMHLVLIVQCFIE